jgi:diacylglycerol kinase family enzyme
VAILPAGTDLFEAARAGLRGDRRRLDTGSVNGERFTVMAGAGFDVRMISDADRSAKDHTSISTWLISPGQPWLSTGRVKGRNSNGASRRRPGEPWFFP